MGIRPTRWGLLLLALAFGCATRNTTAPRTALPGVTEPVERRPGMDAPSRDRGPQVAILAPHEGQRIAEHEVEVVVEVHSFYELERVDVNGLPAVPDGVPGRYVGFVLLRDGPSVPITATARDVTGKTGSHRVWVTVDSSPPRVTAEGTVIVTGTVDSPDTTVTVNGQPVRVAPDLRFTTEVKLDSNRQVTIVATDSFGNRTVKVLDYSR